MASVILGAGPAHAAHFGMYEFIREISGGRRDGWWGVGGTGEFRTLHVRNMKRRTGRGENAC